MHDPKRKGYKLMPYKNPEDKRRWEREHRKQRNAQRRMQHLNTTTASFVPKPTPDPPSDQKSTSAWKGILGLAVGLGVVLLAVLSGRQYT
jgi:ferric-dicitrate binding protein FerR (iron transport regulator)